MNDIIRNLAFPFVNAQTILHEYSKKYSQPRHALSRLVAKGDLIRLKNGVFAIPAKIEYFNEQTGEKEFMDYPFEQIANFIYGPSYVSLEWALSFYGLIPERVTVVTSVTTRPKKKFFKTPIGSFSYDYLRIARYSIGVTSSKRNGQLGEFRIATAEKALADTLFFSCKNMDEEEILCDLIESKRIEESDLKKLRKGLMRSIAKEYNSPTVRHLYNIIRKL